MSFTSASSPNDFIKSDGDGLRVAFGIGGLVAIALGVFIILYPATSGTVVMKIVAIVMAIYALVVGVVYLGIGLFSKNLKGWSRTGQIVLGALYLIAGIVVFANLGATASVLAMFLSITIGILWLFEGVMAFVVVNRGGSNAWSIFYGVISIIAGISLIVTPLAGALTLWWLLGISLVVLGGVQIMRALKGRSSRR